MRFTYFTAIVLVLAQNLCFADPSTLFREGLQKYREGNYSDAIIKWESIVTNGTTNAETYYNLGNAYFRSDSLGRSILNYEKALKLDPRDEDIKHNLSLVKLGTIDKIDPAIRLGIWDYIDSARDFFSLNELAKIFYSLSVLTASIFTLIIVLKSAQIMFLRKVLVILFVMFGVFGSWYAWKASTDSQKQGIIIAKKTDVFSGPDQASTQVFTVHEGTKVILREELTDWVKIRLTDGRQGWLQLTDLATI